MRLLFHSTAFVFSPVPTIQQACKANNRDIFMKTSSPIYHSNGIVFFGFFYFMPWNCIYCAPRPFTTGVVFYGRDLRARARNTPATSTCSHARLHKYVYNYAKDRPDTRARSTVCLFICFFFNAVNIFLRFVLRLKLCSLSLSYVILTRNRINNRQRATTSGLHYYYYYYYFVFFLRAPFVSNTGRVGVFFV